MANPSEICNLALSHLGNGKPVNNYLTETSAEALACRAYFTFAVNATLKAFWWEFAKRFTQMGQVELPVGADQLYGYAYRYPTDCLEIRRFVSGGVLNNSWTESGPGLRGGYDPRASALDLGEFALMDDPAGTVVLTNQSSGLIEYTSNMSGLSSHWPDDFVLTVSYRLAAYIAPRVTAGDPFKTGQNAMQMYAMHLAEARTNDIRQGPKTRQTGARWITERNQ